VHLTWFCKEGNIHATTKGYTSSEIGDSPVRPPAVKMSGRRRRSDQALRRPSIPPRGLLLVGAGSLLAACSSSNHLKRRGHPPDTHNLTHQDHINADDGNPDDPARSRHERPLSISATVAIPIPANVQITGAEAPTEPCSSHRKS